jgi:hypothetical protein
LEIAMKHLFDTVLGWFAVTPEVNAAAVESESDRRLRDLQECGRMQFLP